jgi:hypothetical protein
MSVNRDDSPWLFQVWAAKHILGIAGTIKFLAHQVKQKSIVPKLPRMQQVV